jgi:hypothetical protein
MRGTKHFLLSAGVVALAATSIAAASALRQRAQTADVAATFTATATRSSTRTCQGQGGAMFRITNTVWRGTATSTEPRLAGTLALRTRTVVNLATGDGWLSGAWVSRAIRVARGTAWPRAYAGLTAVIDDATHVDGIANGRVHHPSGQLRGNWSAAIAGDSIAGALGTNAPVAPDNSAIIFRTGCS